MKTKTPFLNFYKEAVKRGFIMPRSGLCDNFNNSNADTLEIAQIFELITPDFLEKEEIALQGNSRYVWASESPLYLSCGEPHPNAFNTFTPLRQTIVLFCAAINNEL